MACSIESSEGITRIIFTPSAHIGFSIVATELRIAYPTHESIFICGNIGCESHGTNFLVTKDILTVGNLNLKRSKESLEFYV